MLRDNTNLTHLIDLTSSNLMVKNLHMFYENVNCLIYADNVDVNNKTSVSGTNTNYWYIKIFLILLGGKGFSKQYPPTNISDKTGRQLL